MHTVSLNIECKNWFDCRFWGSAPGDIHLCTLCTRPHIAFRTQHTELSHLTLAKRARLDSFCLRWLIIEIPFIRRVWMHFFLAFRLFILFVVVTFSHTWLYRESWVSFFLSSVDFELHTFSMGELRESTIPIIIPGAREVIAVRAAQLLIV